MMQRAQFVGIGLLAGLCFWWLGDLPWNWREEFPFLSAVVLATSFFGGVLAMLGELGLRRATLCALAISVLAAGLAALKAQGFASVEQMLFSSLVSPALIAVGVLPVPFAIALCKRGRAGWRDYAGLFTTSWMIVVRYAAAWVFVGVVWFVLWLLSWLLGLVHVDAPWEFLTRAPVAWLVSGGVMGLALSVASDHGGLITAELPLRLLRLLIPLVLLVEAVFVAVLLAGGLADLLLGPLSPVEVLLTTAAVSIALVTITADCNDAAATRAPVLTWSARGLVLFLPVLAGLSVWLLAGLVHSGGWQPCLVALAVAVGLNCAYAAGYLAAVVRGEAHWRATVRQVNIVLALATIGLGVLWLTPLLSAEWIAAHDQVARLDAGLMAPADLPLYEMQHDWGLAGVRAVDALRARVAAPGATGQEALASALASLDRNHDALMPEAPQMSLADRTAALRAATVVLPRGADVPDGLFARLGEIADDDWIDDCRRRTPAGNPGCLLVLADLDPGAPGREAVFVHDADYGGITALHRQGDDWTRARTEFPGAVQPPAAVLIDVLTVGGAATVPADLRALPLEKGQLIVLP